MRNFIKTGVIETLPGLIYLHSGTPGDYTAYGLTDRYTGRSIWPHASDHKPGGKSEGFRVSPQIIFPLRLVKRDGSKIALVELPQSRQVTIWKLLAADCDRIIHLLPGADSRNYRRHRGMA